MRHSTFVRAADGGVLSNRRRRFLTWVFAVIFGAAGPLAAGDVPFASPVDIPPVTYRDAQDVHLADIDDDGDLDVVASSRFDDSVVWFDNTAGDASTWTESTIETTDQIFRLDTADLDGDGDFDVVGVSLFEDQVRWYENNGDGSAWTSHTIDAAATERSTLAVGDVDGDGDVDVVSGGRAPAILWHENTSGDASTWSSHTIPTTSLTVDWVTIADVDGDGDKDVVTTTGSEFEPVSWFENVNGDATSWSRHTTDVTYGASVVAGDIDGDGDTDLAAVSYISGQTHWLENLNGDGTSWQSSQVASGGISAGYEIELIDIDLDGDLDALIGIFNFAPEIRWYENTAGDGSSWQQRGVEDPSSATSITAGDLDNDGDIEIVAASFPNDDLYWYENHTIHRSARFDLRTDIASESATQLRVADVDGDGDLDAVVATDDDVATWHENTAGDGSAWSRHTIAAITGSFEIATEDIDRDGDLDVLTSVRSSNAITWHENTAGDGSAWMTRSVSAAAVTDASDVTLGDLDGDGDVDVISTSSDDDSVIWHENISDGGAFAQRTIAADVNVAIEAASADIDGDGDVDVVSASYLNGIFWHENVNGDGLSWTKQTIDTTMQYAFALATVDLDGDGDTDVVVAGFRDSELSWFENVPVVEGTSWVKHTVSTDPDDLSDLAVIDADGDGDLDLITSSRYSGREVNWYENVAGDASAWEKEVITTVSDTSYSVSVGDIDGDGDPDVMAALNQLSGDDIAWFTNRGGQFALPTTDVAPMVALEGETDAVLQTELIHLGRTGDSDIELTSVQMRLTDARENPLTTEQANAVIETLSFYLDDGDDTFEPGSDTEVASLTELSLTDGVTSFSFADGDPDVTTSVNNDKTFFIVATWADGAGTTGTDEIIVSHLLEGPPASTGEDASADLPIVLEGTDGDASTVDIDIDGPNEIFEDGFENGTTSAWSSTVDIEGDDGD